MNIRVEDLYFSYNDTNALENISFEIEGGEFVGVIGPNGSGKTTLLRLIAGILRGRGRIYLGERDINSMKRREIANLIAYAPQVFEVKEYITLYEIVSLGRYSKLSRFERITGESHKKIEYIMKKVGIWELRDRHFHQLSGGEQKMCLLALTLVQEPRVILLDEPVAHLDIGHQHRILNLIKGINKSSGITVIAVFHDLNIALRFADTFILLKDGRMIKKGSHRDVLEPRVLESIYDISLRKLQIPDEDLYLIVPDAGEE